ncbi:MAG: pyridoxal phosphate-dependent aminotransferase [Patescibacteria group bacterium]|jgi:aspartate aminotransferase
MNLSNRASNTPASPIRKLFPKASEAEKKGIKIYKLNIGQPDLKTPNCIKKRCQNYPKDLVYEPSPGIPELISTWAKYFAKDNLPVTDKDLIITTGGSEAIVFSLLATCDPNDEVIVFEPFYANYKSYAIQTSVKLVPVTLKIEDNFHLPNAEEIEKKITSKTKAILINNPSNPTGAVYKKNELQMITDLAIKHNLFIISDEVYNEFVLDKKNKFISLMSFPKIQQQLILIESASKKFNACGARIGALVSKNSEIIATVTKFAQARLSSPSIEQYALIPIFKTAKKYTQKICQEYKKRRDTIFNGLKKIKGAICLKPEGAFYVIVKLPVDDTEKFCAWLLDKFEYKKQTVMLAPAKDFYATPNMGLQEVRIAYVLKSQDLKKAMEILKIAIEEYNKIYAKK